MTTTLGHVWLSMGNLLCGRLMAVMRIVRSWAICRIWGFKTNGRVYIAGRIFVRAPKRGTVLLGNAVRLFSTRRVNAICRNRTVIDTRKGGVIAIGERSGLSSVMMSSKTAITIGKRVLIGANTCIYDHNFHALKPEDRIDPIRGAENTKSSPVLIEDDCFIGADCMILKGTRIGARSIVAAGSVVFGLDVPPDSLVRGNPAVIAGSRK